MTTSVRIVQEFRSVESEAQRWDLIAEEANSPMHQYAWVKACTDAFTTCGELRLIVVGADQLQRIEVLGIDDLVQHAPLNLHPRRLLSDELRAQRRE